MSVYAFSVYCTSLLQASATLLPVWLDMVDHQKNGGGSLKL